MKLLKSLMIGCLLVFPALLLAKGGGGGGGHGGFGRGPGRGWGGWNPQDFQAWRDKWLADQQKYSEQQKAEETKRKIEKTLADGWKALKAQDSAAAVDAFSDVLELKPDHGEAKLGLGLARAQKGQFVLAQTDLDGALKLKADARLANFNMAVAYSRVNQKPRAMVMMNKLIVEAKGVDEVLVNAQRCILATMDEKTKSTLPAMPGMMKILDSATQSLIAARKPLQRWGVAWMSEDDLKQRQASGEKETLPKEVPFLMPGDIAMPEKGQKFAVNPLKPAIMGQVEVAAANPDEKPPVINDRPAVATATGTRTGTGPFQLGSSSGGPVGSGTSGTTGKTTDSGNTAAPTPPAVTTTPDPVRSVPTSRTVRGAAFAVAPDMVMTCNRLVAGSSSIQLQTIDGHAFEASIVSSDEAAGVAILKVSGAKFTPIALADAPKTGAVNVAAFVRPAIFSPNLDLVRGEIYGAPGKMMLRANSHPRSAGSPVLDDQGKVLGMLVATRDDPAGQLPIIPVDVLKRVSTGKFTAATDSSAADPSQCVVEMTVTRMD